MLPPILNGTVLAGDTVVLFHQDVAAIFDSVSLMRNPNQRQRKRKDFSRDPVPEYVAPLAAPIREVAKVDDRSFVTWGDLNGDASRSFVEVWRLTGHLLQRVHRLTSNEPILDAAIADGRCIAISKPLHQDRTIQVRALTHGARWENVPHSADASSLTTLSDGTVLVANYDGSIHRVNNPDEFLEQLARTQQKNVGNNCKDLKAQSELMLASSPSIEDQKEQALVCMNNFLPSALLPLTLCYEDSTLLDTIIPPPAAPITSNNSPATPVGAAAAGAGQSAVISSPAPIALENYVTIVPLSNGEFALHNTNNNTVQTWQLQHDGSAKKNEHEYTMDQKEERRRLIPLPDGTLLTNIGETGFLHHWNPKTNSAHSYNTGWTRSNDRKLILPLDNGKILIYSQSGYGGIQSAESVSVLDKELKPGKKGFLASDGIVLSDENVVFYAGEQLAIYDSAELIEENNDKPPKYTAHIEKAITHIAKIDKNSFLTWTYYDEQRLKNPCIEIWRIHHDELERIHQIKFLPAMIVSAFVVKNKCYAMTRSGNTYEWDLATGTQWQKISNGLPVTSINVLTDGTVLMARKDGSVCKAHPSTGLAGHLASKQQEKQLRKTLMTELKAKAPKIMAGTLLKKRAH